jgi:hypothetical protein
VHSSKCHNVEECREIKKLEEQVLEQQKQQQHHDGAPPWQWESKQKAIPEDGKDEKLDYQDVKRALKVVYGHSDSDSITDDVDGYHQYHVPKTRQKGTGGLPRVGPLSYKPWARRPTIEVI